MQLDSNAELAPLIARYAALMGDLGDEFGKRPLVVPSGDFFPDRFDKSRAGVTRLLHRMQLHAGLSDVPIELDIDDGGQEAASSCGTGSCAPAQPTSNARLGIQGDTWTLRLSPAELAHPVGLTTLLASALSAIFLEETRPDGGTIAAPFAVTTELAGVGLGLGVLLLEGSYVYSKSCGGPSVVKLTQLGAGQLAPLVALFAAANDHSLKPALRNAAPTQKALLSNAKAWAAANKRISKALVLDPTSLASGDFKLNESSGGLLGLFGTKRSDDDALHEALLLEGQPFTEAPAKRLPSPDPARDELRDLVDGALAEMRQG